MAHARRMVASALLGGSRPVRQVGSITRPGDTTNDGRATSPDQPGGQRSNPAAATDSAARAMATPPIAIPQNALERQCIQYPGVGERDKA